MENTMDMINSIKNHKVSLVMGAVVLSALSYSHLVQWQHVRDLKDQNEYLQVQTQNLLLFTEDKGKILSFEEALAKTPLKEAGVDKVPRVAQKLLELSRRYRDDGITMALLLGLIQQESGFNPGIVSRAADGKTPVAYGLMQVVRSTATPYLEKMGYTWSPEIMYNPEINLEVGTLVLVTLHRQYMASGLEKRDEFTLSLLAYNKGEKTVMESYDGRVRNPILLTYAAQVKMNAKTWERKGF